MRVLITGASGFVGQAAARALLSEGHEVRGLTRDPTRTQTVGVQRVLGSIGDPNSIASAATACDAIVHAAGITSLGAPERVLRWVHIAGTENVLRAARHVGVGRVLHMSCADVSLSRDDRMHWDETRVLAHPPIGAFASSKLMAEEIALSASDDRLEVCALRPALLWGPGDAQGLSQLQHELQRGGVMLYDQGRNVLGTTHIDNLTQAVLKALRAQDAPGRAYYITDGEFLEAREFYTRVLSALGLPVQFAQRSLSMALLRARLSGKLGLTPRTSEAQILRRAKSALFDLSSAAKDLGYTPTLDLDAQLQGLADWVRAEGGIEAIIARVRPEPTHADVDAQVALAGGDS
jgi:2-alkyl-3-oxoalkanoate reductase